MLPFSAWSLCSEMLISSKGLILIGQAVISPFSAWSLWLACCIVLMVCPKPFAWDVNILGSWRNKLVIRDDIDSIRKLWLNWCVFLSQLSDARHVCIVEDSTQSHLHPIPITDGGTPISIRWLCLYKYKSLCMWGTVDWIFVKFLPRFSSACTESHKYILVW